MIHLGDLFDVLPTLDAESIDACVTDGPYGIGFMGREWDTFKPGTGKHRRLMHPREREAAMRDLDTFAPDRIKSAAEMKQRKDPEQLANLKNVYGRKRSPALSPSQIEYDYSVAGLRAFQTWTAQWAREVYRVLKPGAYLLSCGAPRSYHRMACGLEDAGFEVRDCFAWLFGQGYPKSVDIARAIDMSLCQEPGRHCMRQLPPAEKRRSSDHVCAATDLGKQWDGYGSGLKPAHEPICIARKPFKGTLATNVLTHAVGALDIARCRIDSAKDQHDVDRLNDFRGGEPVEDLGRWPANAGFDEEAAALLDAAVGDLESGNWPTTRGASKFRDIYESGFAGQFELPQRRGNSGGPSRFYYVAKPSRAERDFGAEHLTARPRDESRKAGNPGGDNPRNRGLQPRGNFHPTVKPVELMRWLVRLVTPPDGVVLDPFTGSGTTGMACRYEHRRFIGIEREADYVRIAEARIAAVAPLFAPAREA